MPMGLLPDSDPKTITLRLIATATVASVVTAVTFAAASNDILAAAVTFTAAAAAPSAAVAAFMWYLRGQVRRWDWDLQPPAQRLHQPCGNILLHELGWRFPCQQL